MTLDQISVIRRRFYGFGCAVDNQATGLPLPADVIEGSVLDYSGRLVAQPPELVRGDPQAGQRVADRAGGLQIAAFRAIRGR